MRLFSVLQFWLGKRHVVAEVDPTDAIHAVLGKTCPVCGGTLNGHRVGLLASIPLSSDTLIDGYRQDLLHGDPTQLRNESTDLDALQYYLVDCPRTGKRQVVEFISRIELFAADERALLEEPSSPDRLEILCAQVQRWIKL